VTDPVVGAVFAEDTALTRSDRGHAEDLVRETIMRFGIWAARWQLAGPRRAAAAAAVGCLRSSDLQLTAANQDELLATAEESLDLLSAWPLDVTRLA
jgi:hypothetical protein